MSAHVTERLALAAAGALDAGEAERVAAHLGECEACAARAAEWRQLADAMHRLPQPRPDPVLVARTREAVEALVAERAERAFNQAALGFAVALAWTLAIVASSRCGSRARSARRPRGTRRTCWRAGWPPRPPP